MPGRPSRYEQMAAEAAERIGRARELGQQLTFLPDEAGSSAVATLERGEDDRRKRGPGKAVSQLREWLAARGWQLPEDVIGRIAGLDGQIDPVLASMEQAERIIAWAFDGKTRRVRMGSGQDAYWADIEAAPSPEQFLATFAQVHTAKLRAAEALLPYGTPKAAGDEERAGPIVQVVVPQGPSEGRSMRDVTPRTGVRMVPADVRHEMQRNQGLGEANAGDPDAEIRTDEVKR